MQRLALPLKSLACEFQRLTVSCFLKASTTTKASKSPAKVGDIGSSTDFKMVSSGLTENQLQLSVEVSPSSSDLPLVGGERVDWGR